MSGLAVPHLLDDPFGFARAAGQHHGQLSVSAMPRLHDQLAGDAGEVRYSVRGGIDPLDRPHLALEVNGGVKLLCARCAKPLDYALALRTRVLMAQPGAAPQDDEDPESPEWIEAGQELNLQALVEDEILLGLPSRDNAAARLRKHSAKKRQIRRLRGLQPCWNPDRRINVNLGERNGCSTKQEVPLQARHAPLARWS